MPTAVGTKSISGFDPRTVAKCCLWLDAADPNTLFSDITGTTPSTLNGLIALWKDKSSANVNVSNVTSAQQPTYTSAGLSFSGGQTLTSTAPTFSSGGCAGFIVFNPTSITSRQRFCRLGYSTYLVALDTSFVDISIPTRYTYQATNPSTGVNNLFSVVAYSPSNVEWSTNFKTSSTWQFTAFTGTTAALPYIEIGAGGSLGLPSTGTISEIIVYDSFLTVSQKQAIEAYLAWKWMPTFDAVSVPTTLTGCKLWLDGSDPAGTGTPPADGSTVSTWVDKSSNYNATIVSGKVGATYNASTRSVYFSASNMAYVTSYPANPTNETMFVVFNNPTPSANNYTIISGQQGARALGAGWNGSGTNDAVAYLNNDVTWATKTPSNSHVPGSVTLVTGQVVSSTNLRIAINGATFSTGTVTAFSSTAGTYLGMNANTNNPIAYYYIGYAMEIIFYDRVLTTTERLYVENYLKRKWTILALPNSHLFNLVKPYTRFFQPTDLRDCYCWVDAAQDRTTLGSTISTLPDLSGNAPSIAPIGGSITLQANGLNGLPVYNFGTSRAMSEPTFTWNSSFTQFVVVQGSLGYWIAANLVPANNTYYNYSYAGNWALYYDAVMQVSDSVIPNAVNRSVFEYASGGKTSWVIFCIGHRSGDSNLTNYTVNGTVLSSTTNVASSVTNVGKLMLNGNGANSFDTSKVAEFIHYNRSLSQAERQQVEGYLAQKWNIALPTTTGFSPTSITGCSTWLDAADSTTTTSLSSGIWTDKSGRGGNTTSNAGGGAFSISNIFGIPAVSFPTTAGTAALLIPNNASLTTSTGLSVFMVINSTANNGSTRFLTANSGSLQTYVTSGANPTTIGLYTPAASFASPTVTVSNSIPFVYSATIKTDLVRQWSNGIQGDTMSSASSLTITNIYIGNYSTPSNTYAFTGSIGEIIIYSNVVTDVQRKQIELYLTEKWKITSHPFKTISPSLSSLFTPTTLSRCQLWLDGMDPVGTGVFPSAGSTVSSWIDKSGNRNNGTAVGTPTYVSNGGINFTGGTSGPYFLNQNFKMTFANRSMFFVMQETTRTPGAILSLIPTPSNQHDYAVQSGFTYTCDGGFQAFGFWYGGPFGYTYKMGNSTLLPRGIYNDNMNTVVGSGFVNGSNAANKTAIYSATTCSGYAVSARWYNTGVPTDGRLNGVIYEIIAYDRGLTNSERQQVEGYLAWKWNLNTSLPTNHPFYKVSPSPGIRSIMLTTDELYLWLDASDLSTLYQGTTTSTPVTANGQNVGLWLDKSGRSRHYSAQLATYPTYSTKSQVPEVEFNANGKILGCLTLPAGCRPLDIFLVTQPLTSTGDWRTLFRNSDHHVLIENGSYRLGAYYGGQGFQQYGSLTLDGTRRVILHASLSSAGIQSASITPLGSAYDGNLVDGNLVLSVAPGGNNNENIPYLGGTQGGNQPWGNISEIIVFQKTLANQEKIEVFNYLNSKWFTRVTLKNAVDYLPLASNATNLGTTPQTVTTVGNVTYVTVGGYPCAYFDNSFGMYLWFPFTFLEKFTICFWLRPFTVPSTNWTAVSITNTALTNPTLQIDLSSNNVNLTAYAAIPSNSPWNNSVTGSSAVNTWTHYAVTINNVTFVEQLYVNGSLVGSSTGTGAMPSRDRIVLGRSGDGGRAYQGYIRQVGLFNTILTPYEVRDIYLATS